jgi:threonine dehydrogenase-like Zn-dependent dehydrogenase
MLRVPSGTDRIALGHETLQIVLEAPDGANVKPGDVVVVTPGSCNRAD